MLGVTGYRRYRCESLTDWSVAASSSMSGGLVRGELIVTHEHKVTMT